jgi:cytochrome b
MGKLLKGGFGMRVQPAAAVQCSQPKILRTDRTASQSAKRDSHGIVGLLIKRMQRMKSPVQPVRVWDLPTRIFHWTLAACVCGSIVTAKLGGNAMVWHFRLGYLILTLLAFRLVWGVVGGHWSRFASFVFSPATVVRYLRGQGQAVHDVGHSPVGALSVFAVLGILMAQVATGLFADDEIANTGPLIKFVSDATSLLLTKWHKTYGQWIIITLVVLHVAAIAFYVLKKKRDLLRAMVSGDKQLPESTPASTDSLVSRAGAAAVFALCAAGVTLLVKLGG